MKKGKKFDWAAAWRVFLSLLTLGMAWAMDHPSAIITASAVVIVWAINTLAKRYDVRLGRAKLTLILYGAALILTGILKRFDLPVPPVWTGNPDVFAQALVSYAGALAGLASVYVGAATGYYNVLLKQVFDRLQLPAAS